MEYDGVKIGEKIYIARQNKRMSQAEVGEILGIHQTTYSKLESGDYDIPLSQLMKLCECLEISFEWLIGERYVGLNAREQYNMDLFKAFLISRRKA